MNKMNIWELSNAYGEKKFQPTYSLEASLPNLKLQNKNSLEKNIKCKQSLYIW